MQFIKQNTTEWKRENGLKSINFCVPMDLLHELDSLKDITGSTRSEMIRTGMRMYIQYQKNLLADQERKALAAYQVQTKKKEWQVSTGLLPDY